MASLALTRPIYSQGGKISLLQIYISFISHKQLNHPSSLLFKEKLSYDITFPNSWIRCGLFSAWDMAVHRKWELLLEHKALFWLLRAPSSAGSFEATPCIKEPFFPSPESKSEALAQSLAPSLSPLIWTVAVRDEDNPFTLWASQEKTVLWLIPGDQPRKGKETQTAI